MTATTTPGWLGEGRSGRAIPEPILDWLAGHGTASAPHIITTAEQMVLLGKTPVLWDKRSLFWPPISIRAAPEMGRIGLPRHRVCRVLFGDGHVLRGLTMDFGQTSHGTLAFGCVYRGGRISDLGLEDAMIDTEPNPAMSAFWSAATAGLSHAHTLAAACSAGMKARSLGGLIGSNLAVAADCYARGDVRGGSRSSGIGGLVGANAENHRDCYERPASLPADPTATLSACLSVAMEQSSGIPTGIAARRRLVLWGRHPMANR